MTSLWLSPARLPVVRIMLVAFPILFAARTAVTALWSAPSGPWPLDTSPGFEILYWASTGGYLYWATIAHKHLCRSVYLGMSLTMVCMFRAVTVAEARKVFGNVAFSAVVNWASFSFATLMLIMLSAQYIIIHRQAAVR